MLRLLTRPFRPLVLASIGAAGFALAMQFGCNQSTAAQEAQAAASKNAKQATDKYQLPAGGPEELLEFAEEINAKELEGETPEEQRADYLAQIEAMQKAAEKVLGSDASEELKQRAANLKLQALVARYMQFDQPGSLEKLKSFAAELKQSDDDEVAKRGQFVLDRLNQMVLQKKVQQMLSGKPELADEVLAELKSYVQEEGEGGQQLQLALQTAQMIEMVGNVSAAKNAYQYLKETFGDNQAFSQMVKQSAEAGLKRVNLVGQPIEITGETFSGGPIDWSDYRGKVVLVDFWATWCGPCVAEIPHIKEAYQKYHDQGFEVVALSMDESREDLEQFLAENPVPWTVVFPEDEQQRGSDKNPNAKRLGVEFLPTMFLVDQSGQVAAIHPRGERLMEELEKLLPGKTARKSAGQSAQ